ncbi:hypothetical protein MKAN_24405 [Mycobacterium kansasii ATCC 12478]|uniref:Uncharacterized protein n=1 Tax=Mycobacterium kansasii ATCC 12478 TaxID=557599 RepID=U5X2M6_MYCKA|nr:hypothetical protein MKAN_24405 [Mycobacterium kansasii ATCC 12478]
MRGDFEPVDALTLTGRRLISPMMRYRVTA